jgi:hypothetical protein
MLPSCAYRLGITEGGLGVAPSCVLFILKQCNWLIDCCPAGAFMPVLVYALFGSSKELAVGPVAVTSLLISSSLKELVPQAEDITNPNNPPPDMVRVP